MTRAQHQVGLPEQVAFLRLEPLTPVHIGSGETLDPLSYVMHEQNGTPYLYPVDLAAWVEACEDPVALAKFFAEKPLVEIRSYIKQKLDPEIHGSTPARVYSKEIFQKYTQELRAQNSENQLRISSALKTPLTGALLFPGSSIKGAIRTAVIDWLDRNWALQLRDASRRDDKQGLTRKLEEVLGKISDNVFRDLKVSDFPAGLGESLVVTAKEVRKAVRENRSGTPKDDCEVSLSRIMTDEPCAIYGRITLGRHGGEGTDNALTVSYRGQKKAWDLADLMTLCNDFYRQRYVKEKEEFYARPHLAATASALQKIEDRLPKAGESAMLLRLGHYSHVECMTITENQPRTRLVKGRPMPYGTTRTLADGRYPFGWVRVSVCSAEEYQQASRKREDQDGRLLQEQRDRRRAAVVAREAATQARLEREREDRAREETQAKERAAMEAMGPEERLVFLLEQDQANENQAVELFGKLDAMPVEQAVRAAQALKGFWGKVGKWQGKNCTKKQMEKVRKVKALLGEG